MDKWGSAVSEHTPLPWEYDGNYEIIAQKNAYESICVLNVTPRSGANAAFIVKAVNSHAALVEALKFYASAGSWVRDEVDAGGAPAYVPYSEPAMIDRGERALAALALTGETNP